MSNRKKHFIKYEEPKTVTFRIEKEMLDNFRTILRAKNIKQTDLLHKWIKKYISNNRHYLKDN
jgi:hypothetical protein